MRTHISFQQWTARLLAVMALPAAHVCGCDGGTDYPCESPTPVDPNQDTGIEQCAGGFQHRVYGAECPSQLPRPDVCSGEGEPACTTDADCTEHPNGFCFASSSSQGPPEPEVPGPCTCGYGCITDADCKGSDVCVCGGAVGRCELAYCRTDDDCFGLLCTSARVGPAGCAATRFMCQTDDDECASRDDCDDGEDCVASEPGAPRRCEEVDCVVGRPFLVAGEARAARVARRSDWRALAAAPSLEGLDAPLRADLGDYWARAGAMEHASIAAFARFALQLLSLGAPPGLIEDTQDAMRDETEHAALCYGIASAYLGRPVGPAPLDVRGALDGLDAASILTDAIREGCIGETVASMEAAEAAAHASDPVIRAALHRVAEDEGRHAELAWRFVRWAVAANASLRDVAARVFAEEAARTRHAVSVEPDDLAWLARGRVTPAVHRRLQQQAMDRVVAVCARALLENGAPVPRRAA